MQSSAVQKLRAFNQSLVSLLCVCNKNSSESCLSLIFYVYLISLKAEVFNAVMIFMFNSNGVSIVCDVESLVCDLGALLVQQAKCALSMEKALSGVKDKLAHHQQEACTLSFCCNVVLVHLLI